MPDHYAVVGNPIAHSKSPLIHTAFARQTGQDLVYERLLAPLDGFATTVARFAAAGGSGLNVTVPFKVEAFMLARGTSERARVAGAVNTLRREGDAWWGDNTDGAGLVRDLVDRLGVRIEGRDVVILGAGGATRGIVVPLLAQRPRTLTIANRTVDKAAALAMDFAAHGEVRAASAPALEGRAFDLVIHATSADVAGGAAFPWPGSIFAAGAFAYDLTYADQPTAFLRFARDNGVAACADGLGMLIEQAAESFFVWRGVRPDTRPVFGLLRSGG
ncbi:MAG TPA: shikimate dehydrogenase [Casimicrobiaceae bacterium]|jgi:shikimate dehydrogenase